MSDGPAASRPEKRRLEGRLVLVTGGSRGLGLESARALAHRGARLVLVARGAAALEDASASLPGGGHRWLAFDVSDEDAWCRHLEDLDELTGLVTAAGVL